jgi:hypothetical protein
MFYSIISGKELTIPWAERNEERKNRIKGNLKRYIQVHIYINIYKYVCV